MITVYIDYDPTDAIQASIEISQINREENTTTGEYYNGIANFLWAFARRRKGKSLCRY